MHEIEQHNTRHRATKPYGTRSSSPLPGIGAAPYTKPYAHHQQQQQQQPYNRSYSYKRTTSNTLPNQASTWQQLVVGASSAAGTTAAVVSEESMKCMKYCLSWLQYAMRHIEQQMGLIRSFLVSLATSQSSSTTSLSVPTTASPSILSAVKKDVVDTLRKVVDVISRYAGSSLPYHAKVTVRGFILNLPGRWASLNDIRSTTTSPSASPMMSASSPMNTTTTARTINTKEQDVNSPKHEETAIRLLNFGQESVDMLQSISSVFSETVDRAELWLDRLRLRPHENKQDSIINNDHTNRPIQLPPIHTLDPSKNHLNAFDRQSSVTNQFMHSISNEQQQQQQMDLTQ